MSTLGRYVLALAFAAFGLLYLQNLATHAVPPGPPWQTGTAAFNAIAGLFFAGAALALALEKAPRKLAGAAAAILFSFALVVHVKGIFDAPANPGPWTSGCEVIALAGACLAASGLLERLGRTLYGLSLLVVGVQHFHYAGFLTGLIPKMYPFPAIWPYVVGVGFFLGAIALVTGLKAKCASYCLAAMFAVWVVTLHLPRVMGKPHDGKEWTSLFVCLAFSGGALVFTGQKAAKASA